MEDWRKYYKLPLKSDGYNYAWTKDDSMALTFDFDVKQKDRLKIIGIINGESSEKISNLRFDNIDFYDEDNYIFCIRGWGNLTGIGANNLSQEVAANIQDSFRDFVFNKLKGE